MIQNHPIWYLMKARERKEKRDALLKRLAEAETLEQFQQLKAEAQALLDEKKPS